MIDYIALAGVIAALAIGAVSPGPSFVMVARIAVSSSRAHGLCAALGMGAGGVLFAVAALLGLQAILLAVPALYLGLKVGGGAYLCYLGFRIFRAAKDPLPVAGAAAPSTRRPSHSFWLGLFTQSSNPKAAVVYASVFAALLPASFTWAFAATLVAAVFCIEAGWYALVALVLSSARPQRAYLSCKTWVDRAAGVVMVGLGVKLIVGATRP